MNTNVGCWPLVVLELRLLLELELLEVLELLGRSSIQGTATCFPPLLLPKLEELEEVLGELLLSELDDPGEELLPCDELLPRDELELLPGEELLPCEELPLVPELLLELSERTANSIRPDAGLMMVSLMVPKVSPEEPVTLAPVNWLARMS